MLITWLWLAATAPAIGVDALGPDSYRLTTAVAGGTIDAAQALLRPTATRLCGARPATFGRYRFSAEAAGFRVDQELSCGGPAAAGDAPQRAVLAASYAYFAAKDSGRHAAAYAMLSESMRRLAPFAQWRARAADFARAAGAARGRRVHELTWYDHPPDAPAPGVYVAADFSAEFERLDFVCGYLVWLLQPDGGFRLVREEENFVDAATAARVTAIDRAPLRAQMGCKD